MRWYKNKDGKRRKRKFFALFPIQCKRECRWMEMVTISEIYISDWDRWIIEKFIDDDYDDLNPIIKESPIENGLNLLKVNHAGSMELKNGKVINYGVIRIRGNELVYLTGKGLRKMRESNINGPSKKIENEQRLMELGEINTIELDDIKRVIF